MKTPLAYSVPEETGCFDGDLTGDYKKPVAKLVRMAGATAGLPSSVFAKPFPVIPAQCLPSRRWGRESIC
jgi:hypothetical protein